MIGFSRYLRITSICLLFAFNQTSADEPIKCLSLDPNITKCTSSTCETGYCVSINFAKSNCCTESHCPETGLFSMPHLTGHTNSLQWKEQYDEKTWYRKRQMIGGEEDTLTCLIPRSFELNTVATLFNKTSTPRCNVSSDCNNDEFCGAVNNPSFCPQSEVCLDKSAEDGSSLTFCFKLPDVKNRKYLALRKEVGLPICKSNEDCMKEGTNGATSCEKTYDDIRSMNGQKVEMYQSVCARKLERLNKLVNKGKSCLPTAFWISGVAVFIYLLFVIAALLIFKMFIKARFNKERSLKRAENEKNIAADINKQERNDIVIKAQFEELKKQARKRTKLIERNRILKERDALPKKN